MPTPMPLTMIDIFNATRRKDYRQMRHGRGYGPHSLDAEETLRLWKHGYHRGA